ncbi:hypothetical protein VTN96DRAFT_5818 [Rasamsonia emersonii]
MNHVTQILRYRAARATRRTNSERSNLMKLPPELLLMIVESLSPVDIACLALCNHALLRTIGTTSLSLSSQDHERHRELLLTRLARDLPRYYFCYSCSHLHPWEKVGPPGPAFQPRTRLRCRDRDAGPSLWRCLHTHESLSWYWFCFVHLQLAMKRHYYGPGHGPSTESLSFTEVQASDEATTLLSVEARICPAPASLCLRIQQWVVMSSVKADTILSKTPSTLICGHIGSGHTVVSRIVESRSPEIFKCRYCNIDYQLEIKEYPDDRSALVITKWLDLGSGLTPNDPRWRVHIGMGRHAELGASSEAGDVRRRFENGQGLSQDALSCQNESYVMTPNDRSGILDCWGKDIWIQQAGKRLTQSSDEPYTTLLRKMCKVILFLFLCFAYPKLILWWVVLLSRL